MLDDGVVVMYPRQRLEQLRIINGIDGFPVERFRSLPNGLIFGVIEAVIASTGSNLSYSNTAITQEKYLG